MYLPLDKKFVNIGHETLAYVQHGQGKEVVVMLHGNSSSSLHYEPLIRHFDPDYTLYAPDLRGFGDSTYDNRFDSLEELADDVIKFIEKLHLGPVYLVGWSAGGAIAQAVAGERPDLVKKLVLLASGSPKGYPVFKKGAKNEILIGEIYNSKEELATDPVQVVPLLHILETKNATMMSYIWDLTIYNVGKKPDFDAAPHFIQESLKQRCLVDIDWALCKFNISHEPGFYGPGSGLIDRVVAPILVLWGDKDLMINRFMVDEIQRLYKNKVTLITYEDCGHSPIADRPEEVAMNLRNFFKKK